MPEIPDHELTSLMTAIAEMPVPSFYPPGAREAGEPYIERHRIAFSDEVYTVWHNDVPIAPNLDATYQATDEYLEQLDVAGLSFSPPSQRRSTTPS